jgi:succinoglycan biosynthesis protein ExoW
MQRRPSIAIVTPFFQHKPGLLLRAIRSVLEQENVNDWHIIVVDDGSPIDAMEELAPIERELAGRWTLLHQCNRGASAARNTALNELDEVQPIVAFLDSDDVWSSGHLQRISTAFAAGADFYFENYHRYDEDQPRFSRCNLDGRRFEGCDMAEDLYWLDGDFFDILLNGSPATTSTIAYRHAKAPHLRFRTDLWFCEDIFFWMQVSKITRAVAFSRTLGVFCGKGVNISEGAWGTLKLAKVFLSHSRYHRLVRAEFPLTPEQDFWTRSMLSGLDVDFWEAALAAGIRGEYRSVPLVMDYLVTRPQAIGRLPAALAKALHNKFLKPRLA